MKNKISIIILLFTIAIPQIVFASWWNPFFVVYSKWFNSRSPQIQITTEVKTAPTSTIFYVKSNNTRVRLCPSVECKIMGYYNQGNTFTLTSNTHDSLPEWIVFNFANNSSGTSTGYIHKSTLSDKPIEKTKPQADSFTPYKTEPQKIPTPNTNSDWMPLINLCHGKYYPSCSVGQKFYCPAGLLGDGYCVALVQQQINTQTDQSNTILCNGKNWSKCLAEQDFICPATGDAYCQYPLQQPSQQQVQTKISIPIEDIAKITELKALENQYKILQAQTDALSAEEASLPCMSFVTGEMASRCNKLNIQMMDIANQQSIIVSKEALLEGIYLPPPIVTTPTSGSTSGSMQCYWYGMDWICSGPGGTGTNIKCYWYGSIWYCN